MEYTIQQAKDEAVKYCTKDFPVYTYEYDGAGGSMCYIRKDIAEKMAELYASKLREADRKRIEELENIICVAETYVRGAGHIYTELVRENLLKRIEALNL